jgi:uncharacterized protein (TIRG00374 family)
LKKKIFNADFLVTVFCLTIWAVFKGQDLKALLEYLSTANPAFIAASIVCVVAFILSESVIIHYLMGRLGVRTQFSHCCMYSFIGFFYCCITPSASGGQPMQLIAMHKDRIPVAPATVVLAIITIIYKLVLVVLGVVVLLLRPASIMMYLKDVQGILYLGLVLNVICIAALLLLVFRPAVVRNLTAWTLQLINNIRPLKDPRGIEQKVEAMIGQYEGAAEFFLQHKAVMVKVFIITFIQRCLLFLVTWFVFLSFGLDGHSPILITTLQGIIAVAADMMPTPGGMGISETLFLKIFTPIFGSHLVLPGMVISRAISYYTQLLISAVVTAISTFVIKSPKQETTGN